MAAAARVKLRPNSEAPRAVLADRRGTTNYVCNDDREDSDTGLQAQAAPVLVIARSPDGFAVTVEPDGAGTQFHICYSKPGSARTYAKSVARLRDWSIDDRTGEDADV
jgi:hypothetical protein